MKAPAKCGTTSGYQKHRRNGEEPCAECRAGIAAYKREYLARRPDINRKQNDYTKAHNRAAMRLADAHRSEFVGLLAEERGEITPGQRAADRDRVQRTLTNRIETFDEAELLRALTHLAHDPAAMDAVNDALDAVERGDA